MGDVFSFRQSAQKDFTKSVGCDAAGRDPSTTRVTDVANEWGFWHLGQFAADYRRHFGELPSETFERQVPNATP